jgi:hypothetical protein
MYVNIVHILYCIEDVCSRPCCHTCETGHEKKGGGRQWGGGGGGVTCNEEQGACLHAPIYTVHAHKCLLCIGFECISRVYLTWNVVMAGSIVPLFSVSRTRTATYSCALLKEQYMSGALLSYFAIFVLYGKCSVLTFVHFQDLSFKFLIYFF